MFKKLSLAVLSVLIVTGLAYAGGAFNGFPVVGDPGNDICLSFANPTSAVTCTQFSPAGPSAVPPLSTFPADTGLAAGNTSSPATINVPVGLTGATVLDAAPLTGASITVPVGTAKLILNPAGTIATATVLLPPVSNTLANGNVVTLNDGQEFFIYSSQTVTGLTVTPAAGTTLTPSITTVTAAAPVKLIFSKAALAWQLF